MKYVYILLLCAAGLLTAGVAAGITYPMQALFVLLTAAACIVMMKGVLEGLHHHDRQ
ncbi:MAG: hypothetical protein H6591_09720 [Flavobacteriales bacterium]|nr:hypothetical protein [Flavobacteriales bacterium]